MTAQTPEERAAEVFADAWDSGIATWEGDDALAYTRHCMQAVADAGLLATPERLAEVWGEGYQDARRRAVAYLTGPMVAGPSPYQREVTDRDE